MRVVSSKLARLLKICDIRPVGSHACMAASFVSIVTALLASFVLQFEAVELWYMVCVLDPSRYVHRAFESSSEHTGQCLHAVRIFGPTTTGTCCSNCIKLELDFSASLARDPMVHGFLMALAETPKRPERLNSDSAL